jgi:hypothetical protein
MRARQIGSDAPGERPSLDLKRREPGL